MKKAKKLVLALLVVFLFSAICMSVRITALAEESTVIKSSWSGVDWKLDTGTGELIISKSTSGSGYINPFASNSTSAWRSYVSDIKTVTINEGVTNVPAFCFYNCTNLTSVLLPDSVTLIGNSAFKGCYKLSEINIPAKLTDIGTSSFENCSAITDLTFPSTLTKIGNYAFRYCSGLKSIETPKYLTSVGTSAFDYCSSLTTATVHSTSVISALPKGNIKTVIVKDVTSLPSNCFNSFTSLESVSLPEGITSLSTSCFQGCKKLKNITIPESVNSLGQWAFSGCTALESIEIPKNVTSLGYSVFSNCDSLTSVTIPAGVTYFDNYTFWMCDNLTSVVFDEGSKLTSIGNTTFASCPKLVSVTLPRQIESIEESTFSGCYALKEVFIPASVKTIEKNAFASCTSFEKITYCGTNEDWNGITKADTWAPPTDYSIQYHDYVNNVCSECGDDFPCNHATGFSGLCSTCNRYVGSCGADLTYTLDTNIGRLIIWGTGAMTDYVYYSKPAPWDSNRSYIQSIGVKDGVTSIGNYAFSGCSNLTSVVLPESIDAVSSTAFSGCNSAIQKDGGVSYVGNCVIDCDTSVTSVVLRAGTVAIAEQAFYGCSKLTSIVIPKSVRSIGNQAFYNCTSLSSLVLEEGSNLRTINKFALYDCPITSLTIPTNLKNVAEDSLPGIKDIYIKDVKAYLNINGTLPVATDTLHILNYAGNEVTSLVIPSGITSIPYKAFYNAKNLVSVTIPDGVTSIDKYAFYSYPSSITTVYLPGSLTNIGYCAFYSSGDIAFTYCGTRTEWANVIRKDNWAVEYGNYNYTDPSISNYHKYSSSGICTICGCGVEGACGDNLVWSLDPATNTLTISGNGSMYNYGNSVHGYDSPWATYNSLIKYVIVEEGVTSIGDYAFYENESLTGASLPESITSIGKYSFYCSGLQSITIPSCVTSIGEYAFDSCKKLTEVVYCDGALVVGAYMFSYCTSLKSLSLPNSVSEIGSYAFSGCISLETVNIPDGITIINSSVFNYCSSLTSIEIPKSVTTIGTYAFNNCTNLTQITIPEGVKNIGSYAFYYCTGLITLTYCGTEEQWNEVNKSSSWNASSTFTVSFHNVENCICIECGSEVHSWDEGVVTVEPTHTTEGVKLFTCACGSTYTEAVATLAHEYTEDGSCSVCGAYRATFSGASLTLEDTIAINFKVASEQFEGTEYSDPYVVFIFNEMQITVTTYGIDSKGQYSFSFNDIAPRMMNDVITATLYATYEGETVACQTRSYSVKEYCYNMLSRCNEGGEYASNHKFKALLVDLLNYGEAAQIYGDYKTDTLVTADLTEVQKGWATSENPSLSTVHNMTHTTIEAPLATWKAGGLLLEDAVTMRFKFSVDSIEGITVKFYTDSNPTGWTVGADALVETSGGYYVYFDGLKARQMRETVYVTIYRGDTAISDTVSYSIESYAYAKKDDSNAKLTALLEAMMKYGDSAYKYINE